MEGTTNDIFGTLSSAPDNTIVNKIYDYLSIILTSFKGKIDENENSLTNRLCIELNKYKPPEYPFFIHHQNLENDKEGTSTDFAVFSTCAYSQDSSNDKGSSALIKFEAKRLSSKLSKDKKNREKEYVLGEYNGGSRSKNSGGIERFKNGRHGKDVLNAGLIGYIQTDSPKQWLQKVNSWISEQIHSSSDPTLTWRKEDMLVLNSENDFVTSYSSVSTRSHGNPIAFRHFWIDITNK